MRKRSALAVLVGTSLVFSSGGLAATAAGTDAPSTPEEIHSALQEALPEVLSGLTAEPTIDTGETAIVASDGDTTIEVPRDPASGIGFVLPGGESVSVGLPFSDQASDAFVVQPGVVGYDNANGSTTVPAVKDDGSVQISTVIESVSAPTHYEYPFVLPEGSELVLLGTKDAIVTAEDGSTILHIAPPVARDSADREVATRYEVSGHTLIQIVELSETATYPIVADPWINSTALITKANVTYPYPGLTKYKINVTPSAYGGARVGPLYWGAWESELKAKLGVTSAPKVTYVVREQLNCHLAGYPLSLPEFNLESWRVSMSWSDMAPYNCNYPEGGWGSVS